METHCVCVCVRSVSSIFRKRNGMEINACLDQVFRAKVSVFMIVLSYTFVLCTQVILAARLFDVRCWMCAVTFWSCSDEEGFTSI